MHFVFIQNLSEYHFVFIRQISFDSVYRVHLDLRMKMHGNGEICFRRFIFFLFLFLIHGNGFDNIYRSTPTQQNVEYV